MTSTSRHHPNDDPSSVEAMLRSAGDYIEVNPYLRPALLEEAAATIACHRAWHRGGLLATLILCITIPLASVLSSSSAELSESAPARDLTQVDRPVLHVTSADVELTAAHLEPHDRVWGMVRVFRQLQTNRQRAFKSK